MSGSDRPFTTPTPGASVIAPSAARFADALLDRTLIGYGNVGYLLRRHWWAPDAAPDALEGKTAVVTGAKRGLGLATAIGLARLGAHVRIVVRGRAEGRAAAAEIERAAPGARVTVEECDVSMMADVRQYAASLAEPIHVLVHNAGVMPDERGQTPEGNELMLATHVLGPHLLTALAQPALAADTPACVIWVSSGGQYGQKLVLDDVQYRRSEYRPAVGYARTKHMQVALARVWADRVRDSGLAVHAAHPGWVDTPGVVTWLPRFRALTRPLLRTPEQGADTFVWLGGTDPKRVGSGRFWHDRAPRPFHYLPSTRESAADRDELWQICQRLTALA